MASAFDASPVAFTVPSIELPPAAIITAAMETKQNAATTDFIHPPLERESQQRIERVVVAGSQIALILDHRLDVGAHEGAHIDRADTEALHRPIGRREALVASGGLQPRIDQVVRLR